MKRTKPPFDLIIRKGNRYVVLKRDLAEFFTKHPISIKFYNWITDMKIADESFYSTLVTVNVTKNGKIIQDLNTDTFNRQASKVIFVAVIIRPLLKSSISNIIGVVYMLISDSLDLA